MTIQFRTGKIETTQPNPAIVVGLYSFPKSGNTWLRAIIGAITGMPHGPGMMQRYVTDSHYGPVIENPWMFQKRDWYFYKSHRKTPLVDHLDQNFDTDKFVYIYRHPLDVFVSYLNFVSKNVSPNAGQSLPVQFDKVEDLDAASMERLFAIFLEHATLFPRNKTFGGVFEHLALFRQLQENGSDVLILRYEDLMDNFNDEIIRLCDFLGFGDIDHQHVFDTADKRTRKNGKFFWKRQKENYRNYLTEDQIERFNTRYAKELQDQGYEV